MEGRVDTVPESLRAVAVRAICDALDAGADQATALERAVQMVAAEGSVLQPERLLKALAADGLVRIRPSQPAAERAGRPPVPGSETLVLIEATSRGRSVSDRTSLPPTTAV